MTFLLGLRNIQFNACERAHYKLTRINWEKNMHKVNFCMRHRKKKQHRYKSCYVYVRRINKLCTLSVLYFHTFFFCETTTYFCNLIMWNSANNKMFTIMEICRWLWRFMGVHKLHLIKNAKFRLNQNNCTNLIQWTIFITLCSKNYN